MRSVIIYLISKLVLVIFLLSWFASIIWTLQLCLHSAWIYFDFLKRTDLAFQLGTIPISTYYIGYYRRNRLLLSTCSGYRLIPTQTTDVRISLL